MRLSSIVREAWRNLVSGTTHAVSLAVALMLTSLILLGADILAVLRFEDDAATFHTSGASMVTISSPGKIDGQRCEGLRRLPGVTAAGAIVLSTGSTLTAAALPDAPIPVGVISPDFPLAADALARGSGGVVLSGEAADMLGIGTGDLLTTTDGRTTVAGVYDYPRDGRRSGFGYMVLVPGDVKQDFDECWVEAWPPNSQITSLLLTALVPGTATDDDLPVVGQLNSSLGHEFDGYVSYTHRLTRFGGPVAGIVAAVIGFLALRIRRLQLASSLHGRVARRDLALICSLEAAVWVLPAPLACLATSIAVLGAPPDGAVAAIVGARVAVPVVIGAALGQTLALATTRERHLFAYAKDR